MSPASGEGFVLNVGTTKGLFIFTSDMKRRKWKMNGPHFAGSSIYHAIYDRRNSAIFASAKISQFASSIVISKDMGKIWNYASNPPRFSSKSGLSVENIWQIKPAGEQHPSVLYAGTQPACLFRSDNAGMDWKVNRALEEHSTRHLWTPGFGGLCLHTILLSQNLKKIHVGISAVGTLSSIDAGESWTFTNSGVRAEFLPEKFPVFGQCVHKVVAAENRGVLYQQNHCGVYRSNDGESWKEITSDLPSDFGFPIATARVEGRQRVYVAPLQGADCRLPEDGHFRVWWSDNEGRSW